jgi:hypothetical protein
MKSSASKVSALSAALSSQIITNLFIFTRNRRHMNYIFRSVSKKKKLHLQIFRSSPSLDLLLGWSYLRHRQIYNRDTIDYSHHVVKPPWPEHVLHPALQNRRIDRLSVQPP